MPISEEPNFGDWSIIINEKNTGKSERISFTVNKYVLPKFGASIIHHERIRIDEKEVNVTVCGKYSNGKGVHGSYALKVSTKKWSYKAYKMLVDEFSEFLVLEKTVRKKFRFCFTLKCLKNEFYFNQGCHTFVVDLTDLTDGRFVYDIYFDASVIESGTGIKEVKESKASVTYESMNIEVSNIEYYKPGFPINFEVISFYK